ncbi:T9SS type A sorting domain-containing protein [Hymenobacter edaphi]|uniref:Secretion system C-terminal sorting domain-containing protein n=1 Tax=Hymenobacter edaphi TaxID=2211146 RepID=A0A328BH38_9BACT|nr:T9SS type A sorting domain-containing protein [Hymenobacter edaphi]RAK65955.1 hypothetical protein DLM85_14695 [Hymenobacter edaphi]
MNKNFTRLLSATLVVAGLGLPGLARAQATYTQISLTGFNQDVIANGSGAATTSTTYDLDGSNGAAFVLMAPNFVNPSGAAPTRSLPANGVITSAVTTGVTYQLAPYTGNNDLRIPLTGSSTAGTGTLTFASPRAANTIYVLVTSGAAPSTVTPTVTFTDGTTQVFTSQTVLDWFDGANPVVMGLGRVGRTAASGIENLTTNPRLYQMTLPIAAANQSKLVQSISFNKTSTTGVLNVLAATVLDVPLSSRAPKAGVVLQAVPNPARETITLRVDKAAKQATATLLDLTGRELQAAPVHNQQASFALTALPAGVYLVRYQNEIGSQTIKVVKE